MASVAYVVVACAALAVLVWSGLTAAQRNSLGEALSGQTATLVLGGLMALAGLVVTLSYALGRYPVTAGRLAADTRILLGANPDHRVEQSGPPELRELASAVNDLAERRRVAEREVAQEAAAARADVEQERNRLAALMADLDVAVLVCSLGGRILLYNAAARALLADDPALGLGRSVFGIVDWGLVTHALDRIRDGSAQAQVSTTLRAGQLLHVRLTPVRDQAGEVNGFVLVLADLTSSQETSGRRDALLHEAIETTRASLASIQAAVEAVLDYPDMDTQERSQFVEIVREESQRLGRQVEEWAVASAANLGADWLLTDMQGEDLLAVLGREVEREDDVATSVESRTDGLWVRVDSHAISRAAVRLVARLRAHCLVREVTLSLTATGHHAGLDVRWTGSAPDAALFNAWLQELLTGGTAGTVQEVVERHNGEIWSGNGPDGSAYIRLLLPLTEAAPQPDSPAVPGIGSRPELDDVNLYDFDLFDLPEGSLAWQDRRLADLAYTVFDTETTGLDPAAGDEIVSVGAVRVVNGRLLRHETFERLVDPRRSVPARSVAIHGITADMLRGQPTMEVVLPVFARFAEDTVLVGHNVGFDMSFLRRKEAQTGVRFTQPVLDTLLLDAALHPDHEQHSLEAIATRLGVGVVGRHTALGDALMTGEVFVRLLTLLQQRGIQTLGEALAAARATYQSRLDARLYGG
ncbi:MAG: exonuclease domain-containing protein [Dermatophilaceae bacterium]